MLQRAVRGVISKRYRDRHSGSLLLPHQKLLPFSKFDGLNGLNVLSRLTLWSHSDLTFQYFQAIVPVHEIQFPVFVVENVVAHDDLLAFAGQRDMEAYFLGNIWIGEIDRP